VGPRGLMAKPNAPSASAPAILDKSTSVGASNPQVNGEDFGCPSTTHLDDASSPSEDKTIMHDKQQNSDPIDRTSQATSATTSKLPLSPNTPGTSVMSRDSEEKQRISTSGGLSSIPSQVTNSTSQGVDETNGNNKSPFRGLRKKASS